MTTRSAHTQHQPRDEARSPIRERPEKKQTKNTEQNSECSSSLSLAPP